MLDNITKMILKAPTKATLFSDRGRQVGVNQPAKEDLYDSYGAVFGLQNHNSLFAQSMTLYKNYRTSYSYSKMQFIYNKHT